MKGIFIKAMLLTNLALVGCSTNTQSQNTTAGVLMGAAAGGLAGNAAGSGARHGTNIAAGAVVGALIGGLIGHYLDSTDHNTTYPFLSKNQSSSNQAAANPND